MSKRHEITDNIKPTPLPRRSLQQSKNAESSRTENKRVRNQRSTILRLKSNVNVRNMSVVSNQDADEVCEKGNVERKAEIFSSGSQNRYYTR